MLHTRADGDTRLREYTGRPLKPRRALSPARAAAAVVAAAATLNNSRPR